MSHRNMLWSLFESSNLGCCNEGHLYLESLCSTSGMLKILTYFIETYLLSVIRTAPAQLLQVGKIFRERFH